MRPRQVNRQLLVVVVDASDGRRVDHYVAAQQPRAGVHQPAQLPGRVVEQEIADGADPAVAGLMAQPFTADPGGSIAWFLEE